MIEVQARKANLYIKRTKIRFSHCDPAGAVFFPRYLSQLSDLIEDWFGEVLNINYAAFLAGRNISLPVVKIECEFLSRGVHGGEIEWQLSVLHVGSSSMILQVIGCDGNQQRFRLKAVLVATEGAQESSTAIPPDLRDAIFRFRTGGHLCSVE